MDVVIFSPIWDFKFVEISNQMSFLFLCFEKG